MAERSPDLQIGNGITYARSGVVSCLDHDRVADLADLAPLAVHSEGIIAPSERSGDLGQVRTSEMLTRLPVAIN
jgi:hypothetical protein